MPVDLILTPSAVDDVDSAYDWYEARRTGLGEDFLDSLDAVLNAIRNQPAAYTLVHANCRRALLRRFPYGVLYELMPAGAVVYAVLHSARTPDVWEQRRPQ